MSVEHYVCSYPEAETLLVGKWDKFNTDGKSKKTVRYFGELDSALFRGVMQGYHHEKGSTVFLKDNNIVLIGDKSHIYATKKSIEDEFKIKIR